MLWGYVNNASTLAVFLTAPILSAIADRLGARRALLSAFRDRRGLLTALLGLCGAGDVFTTLLIYASLSQFDVTSRRTSSTTPSYPTWRRTKLDRLSARGFAVGYVGARSASSWRSSWWRRTPGGPLGRGGRAGRRSPRRASVGPVSGRSRSSG
ncbi:MAG: hypothetical protein IPF66_24180 [Holophagales bacterium]|nr:hypothetical protein [Holophagales bacterium]